MSILDLSISSELENVELLDTSVAGICKNLTSLSGSQTYEVQLAVAEWLTNIVKHSYKGQAGHPIWTKLELKETHLIVTITDQGKELPGDIPQKLHTPSCCCPDYNCECGRGLYCIAQSMDKVCCQRKKGRNIIKMTKFYNDLQ